MIYFDLVRYYQNQVALFDIKNSLCVKKMFAYSKKHCTFRTLFELLTRLIFICSSQLFLPQLDLLKA